MQQFYVGNKVRVVKDNFQESDPESSLSIYNINIGDVGVILEVFTPEQQSPQGSIVLVQFESTDIEMYDGEFELVVE